MACYQTNHFPALFPGIGTNLIKLLRMPWLID
ncbi:hypothetical protein ES288_D07G224700v1 [Gossypium darwinii]|uniref:Uncharacterized protein n=1 Tax=Gossypium darwinii TaxID=34276 RepID=A0A5D2BZC7_GOSDA|nr:hypothetical protein ES288_D07G224700v1 [Gossypium darwinii]